MTMHRVETDTAAGGNMSLCGFSTDNTVMFSSSCCDCHWNCVDMACTCLCVCVCLCV